MIPTRKWHVRELSLIVKPEGDPIFSEMATVVKIDDESGGPFVAVTQSGREGGEGITIDPDEWPHIRKAIDRMISACAACVDIDDSKIVS